jgi:hypothetical protein
MKTLKTLTLSLLAAAFAGTAASAAPTIIHVVGSTAFRAPATAAMIDYLSNNGANAVYAGYTGSSLLGAGSAILANGTVGSGGTATIVIETYWTGSLAGLVDLVAGNITGSYLDVNNLTTADSTGINTVAKEATVGTANNSAVYGGGYAITDTPNTTTSAPDVTFSDSHKLTIAKELSTATLAPAGVGSYTSISALAAAVGGNTVVDSGSPSYPDNNAGTNAFSDGFVGIVPFEWVSGNGAFANDGGVTNISQQAVKTLLTQGVVDQALLTGTNNAADTANSFYLTGRNEDSGTRIDSFSEAQFGVTTPPLQYQSNFTLFPAGSALNTEPNISWPQSGHSGYATGGNVATALDVAESAPSFLIGYLGVTDAVTAVSGGGKALTYAGEAFSVPNVQNGLYTLWGYEHCYHLSTLSGTPLAAANAIADGVHNTNADVAGNGKHTAAETPPYTDASAGILNDLSFNVYRPVQPEGGPISHF